MSRFLGRSKFRNRRLAVAIWISLSSTLCPGLSADFEAVTHEGITFIQVPAGSFLMGTTESQRAALNEKNAWTRFEECERPAHRVTIANPFLISKFEVTQEQWQRVMENNPSAFKEPKRPIESVSWNDVQEFVGKLNAKGSGQYRLPTEAEWEYCCRAGSTNLFGLGREAERINTTNLTHYAWYRTNAENRTHAVGEKKPNAWGIHDLHGNVWEWCQDWYSDNFYTTASSVDPLNSEPATERVLRGGSWFLDWPNLRASFRSGNLPNFKSQFAGFRLVRELGLKAADQKTPPSSTSEAK